MNHIFCLFSFLWEENNFHLLFVLSTKEGYCALQWHYTGITQNKLLHLNLYMPRKVIKLQKPYGCHHEMIVVISNGCKIVRRTWMRLRWRIWKTTNIRWARLSILCSNCLTSINSYVYKFIFVRVRMIQNRILAEKIMHWKVIFKKKYMRLEIFAILKMNQSFFILMAWLRLTLWSSVSPLDMLYATTNFIINILRIYPYNLL